MSTFTFTFYPLSYLFYTDADTGDVGRCALDGTDTVTLTSSPHPTSLVVDVTSDMVYWLDNGDSVWSCTIHGTAKNKLFTLTDDSLHGIAVFGVCCL